MKKLLFLSLALTAALYIFGRQQSTNYEITPEQKLRMAAVLIESYYVEEVNSDSIVDQAIIAMLETLDPVSYTHLRAHETSIHLVCRLLVE